MSYLGYSTFETKRPSRSDNQHAKLNDKELARVQAAWDDQREADQQFNAVLLGRVAEAARKEVARQDSMRRMEQERREKVEGPLLAEAESAFFRAGGTREEWQKNKGEILEQARARVAVDSAAAAVAPAERLTGVRF